MDSNEKKSGKKSLFRNLYPDYIYKRIEDIPYELFRKEDIKLVLMDMDNTLVDYKKEYTKSVRNWVKEMKSKDLKLYIVSNSMSDKTVKRVSKELGLQYFHKANKPSRNGFRQVCKNFPDIKKEQIIMIGDQLFTDVWGGNRFKIKTLLVDRINKKEIILSSVKRPLEKMILNHYYTKKESEGQCRI